MLLGTGVIAEHRVHCLLSRVVSVYVMARKSFRSVTAQLVAPRSEDILERPTLVRRLSPETNSRVRVFPRMTLASGREFSNVESGRPEPRG